MTDRHLSPQLKVRFTPDLDERIREDAERQGVTLTQWLSEAAEARLNAPERPSAGTGAGTSGSGRSPASVTPGP